jgi:hypothetical protein
VAQRTPQPVFTELFAYDPAAPSQLLGKWLISSQLDSKLQPLRVGVVDPREAATCNGLRFMRPRSRYAIAQPHLIGRSAELSERQDAAEG